MKERTIGGPTPLPPPMFINTQAPPSGHLKFIHLFATVLCYVFCCRLTDYVEAVAGRKLPVQVAMPEVLRFLSPGVVLRQALSARGVEKPPRRVSRRSEPPPPGVANTFDKLERPSTRDVISTAPPAWNHRRSQDDASLKYHKPRSKLTLFL